MDCLKKDLRFFRRLKLTDKGCLEYQGSLSDAGYGRVRRRKIQQALMGAHRYAFFLANGYWPPMVCHSCDNPPCCNPEHLFAGNHEINMQDCYAKGRGYFCYKDNGGENNGNSKLKKEDVIKIKELIKEGKYNTYIAGLFNITHSAVSLIRLGKTWNTV